MLHQVRHWPHPQLKEIDWKWDCAHKHVKGVTHLVSGTTNLFTSLQKLTVMAENFKVFFKLKKAG